MLPGCKLGTGDKVTLAPWVLLLSIATMIALVESGTAVAAFIGYTSNIDGIAGVPQPPAGALGAHAASDALQRSTAITFIGPSRGGQTLREEYRFALHAPGSSCKFRSIKQSMLPL